MNAYAQNSSSSGGGDGGGYAPLTQSLLARKGEAMPAVDADAHEGVDIEMRELKPANSPGAPKQVSEDAIETLYAENIPSDASPESGHQPGAAGAQSKTSNPPQTPVRLIHSSGQNRVSYETKAKARTQISPPPAAWTVAQPQRSARAALQLPSPSGPDRVRARMRKGANPLDRKATVTLRMPARDLVRLRFSSRDMEMSCQEVILEALECYLDANEMPPVTDDAIIRETKRLLSKVKKRRKA